MTQSMPPSKSFTFRLCNSLSEMRELWIEPLGDKVSLPSGVAVQITISDELGELPELEITEDCFVIHAWVKTIALIRDDGSQQLIWGA